MLAERLALAGEADEAIALALTLEENAEGMDKVRSAALNTITFYLAHSGNDAKAIEAARGIRDKQLLPYALGTIAEAQARQGDAAAAMRTVESIEAPEARIRALVGNTSERNIPGSRWRVAARGTGPGPGSAWTGRGPWPRHCRTGPRKTRPARASRWRRRSSATSPRD